MSLASSRTSLFVLAIALVALGCTDGGTAMPEDDAAVVPVDANDVDAFDEFATATVCTSGVTWNQGDFGTPEMHPGRACLQCHATERRAPSLSLAGTVYPTGHEPDECNGVDGFFVDAHVIVTDAAGHVHDMQLFNSGSFYSVDPITFPITAEIQYQGRSRRMTTPAPSGDCNLCHTEQGTSAAPGRILLP